MGLSFSGMSLTGPGAGPDEAPAGRASGGGAARPAGAVFGDVGVAVAGLGGRSRQGVS